MSKKEIEAKRRANSEWLRVYALGYMAGNKGGRMNDVDQIMAYALRLIRGMRMQKEKQRKGLKSRNENILKEKEQN
jgi:hypothetical protein